MSVQICRGALGSVRGHGPVQSGAVPSGLSRGLSLRTRRRPGLSGRKRTGRFALRKARCSQALRLV